MFNFLFPRSCVGCGVFGSYFCPSCSQTLPLAKPICPVCQKASIAGVTHPSCRTPFALDGLVSVFRYQGPIQRAIKRLKYRMVREMAQSFIDLAVRRIDQSNLGFFQSKRFVVSSVPLHEKRLRYRGFNQSALLGSLLSKRMGLEYEELVVRKRHIRPLAELRVSLTKEERKEICERYVSTVQREEAEKKLLQKKKMDARRKATKGIFELKDRSYSLAQKNFLIVDDVWTSGATLLECGKVLKRREVQQVWGWAFSRSSGV